MTPGAFSDTADHLRDGDPQPGRYARNGRRRGLLGRGFGPPRDEGAWERRKAEIRVERETAQRSATEGHS